MHSLTEIRELMSIGDIENALLRIEKFESLGLAVPQLLVLKSMCIQLGTGEQKYGLSDVENALESALQIDSNCVEALIESAQYWFYVEDDAKRALPLFQKAFEISKGQILEAITGIAECMNEVSSSNEARAFLKGISSEIIDEQKLQLIQEEIESFFPN